MIYINYFTRFHEPQVLVYNEPTKSVVDVTDLKLWIVDKMGLAGRTFDIKLFHNDLECLPADQIFTNGTSLNMIIVDIWFDATLFDHTDNCCVVWAQRFQSEREAAQNLLVWLIQHKWLNIENIDSDEDEEAENNDGCDSCDASDRSVKQQIDDVMNGVGYADMMTSDDLWNWCKTLSPDFVSKWSFRIDQHRKSIE